MFATPSFRQNLLVQKFLSALESCFKMTVFCKKILWKWSKISKTAFQRRRTEETPYFMANWSSFVLRIVGREVLILLNNTTTPQIRNDSKSKQDWNCFLTPGQAWRGASLTDISLTWAETGCNHYDFLHFHKIALAVNSNFRAHQSGKHIIKTTTKQFWAFSPWGQ